MDDALRSEETVERKPMDQAAWERFKEEAKRQAHLATFEGCVGHLEKVCLRTPGAWPTREIHDRPPENTRARYAEDILFAIRAVRDHLARGEPSYAASEALIVGALAMEAEARFNWHEIKAWRAMREGQEKSRATQAQRQRELLEAVDELRARHPGKYDSARAAATKLIDSAPYGAEPWGYDVDSADPQSREHAIAALSKRILRAEKALRR